MHALPAGSLEYSVTTSSAAWSICPSSATQQLHVRLPRYRCTNTRCLQKIFRAGLTCAPDNSKTTDQVTHWILQRLCLNRMSVAAAPKTSPATEYIKAERSRMNALDVHKYLGEGAQRTHVLEQELACVTELVERQLELLVQRWSELRRHGRQDLRAVRAAFRQVR